MSSVLGGKGKKEENNAPWKEQQPYLADLFRRAQTNLQQPVDIGASTALYGQSLDALKAYTSGGAERFANNALDANNFLLTDARDPDNNPNFQRYLDISNNAISDSFNRTVVPTQTSNSFATGNIGSSREGVVKALGNKDLLSQIGQNTGQLTDRAYGRGLNATIKGLALAPQTAQLGNLQSTMLARAAQFQQGMETRDVDFANQRLAQYQSLIGGNYGSQRTQSNGGITRWQGALSGAAAGGSVGGWWGAAAGAILGYFASGDEGGSSYGEAAAGYYK